MTIRLDMRRTVSKGSAALGDSVRMVKDFLGRQLMPDGGFRGRGECSDLYYTVFGLEASLSLGIDLARAHINDYLTGFGAGPSLDFVHLTCLIRCRADMSTLCSPAAPGWEKITPEGGGATRPTMIERLLEYRSPDGGFNMTPGDKQGSAYGNFLALGACQDLQIDVPDIGAVAQSTLSLRRSDGGFANEPAMTASVTTATAAAICVLHYLKQSVPESAVNWLLDRAHPLGGFTAISFGADHAIPDLLSTATALHALSLIGASTDDMRDKHLDYLDSLWSPQGGFRGHWADDAVDCEYTYYGLLSLGSLAE